MGKMIRSIRRHYFSGLLLCIVLGFALPSGSQAAISLHNSNLSVSVSAKDGSYEIRTLKGPVLAARVGAEVNHRWLRSSDYPRHEEAMSSFQDALGAGQQATVTFTGMDSEPDLVCVLRIYNQLPYGTVEVKVVNRTSKAVSVQEIRVVDATGKPRIRLDGPEGLDRIMLESYSEDPPIKIGGLDQAPGGVYFGVQDGLVYNLASKESLLLAALTSKRFLTVLHLKVAKLPMSSSAIDLFTVDSAGTTQAVLQRDQIAPAQRVELSLPVEPGKELDSEWLMFAAGPDYHAQLEAYGAAVRRLHHARVRSRPPMGWWSWTAFYGGVNEGEVLTNAKWLARHLKLLGYNYFHIDEGYDYARGEYTTTNVPQFPDGMRNVGYKITHLGLTLGVWTAPFEVSSRAWVYEHHKDWLVHDARGKPIWIGGHIDHLYVLDTTNPGAEAYLRKTYRILTRKWGVRYIKLDFMDSTAIEGYYYRLRTTALEAQRLGLQIIRQAVGDGVLLDKDGSPMLNPVGLVDEGRISVDTSHSFEASKHAVPNIAVRYYMNRNFYISDPDAFNVSTEVQIQQPGQKMQPPLTLEEAQVQIVLAAVAGGMYEIGDDLPTLAADPQRLALVRNRDLLRMVELRRAAIPVDLMTFHFADQLPSVFFLREDNRQAMLAVFNWTEHSRARSFQLSGLSLPPGHPYEAYDALNQDRPVATEGGRIVLQALPRHSVRLIKIIDTSVPAAAPTVSASVPESAQVGEAVKLQAVADASGVPALTCHWEFGDGTVAEGCEVTHTYTMAGVYNVKLAVEGVDGIPAEKSFSLAVRGPLKTASDVLQNRRYVEPGSK